MSSVSKDFEEKRNFIRMFVNTKVTLTDPATGRTFDGDSKNLSGDGILVRTKAEFKLDQELNINVRSEKSKIAPLSAQFTVKRIEKLDNGIFEIGGPMKGIN